MTELFNTRDVRDDPEHWDALANRVAATAVLRSKEKSSFGWFAHSRASWAAASVLLAAALTFMVLVTRRASLSDFSVDWGQALGPTDQVGKTMILRDRPPALGALLIGTGDGGDR
jgi:hypothetical protein